MSFKLEEVSNFIATMGSCLCETKTTVNMKVTYFALKCIPYAAFRLK